MGLLLGLIALRGGELLLQTAGRLHRFTVPERRTDEHQIQVSSSVLHEGSQKSPQRSKYPHISGSGFS